jgi:hypothetical protein
VILKIKCNFKFKLAVIWGFQTFWCDSVTCDSTVTRLTYVTLVTNNIVMCVSVWPENHDFLGEIKIITDLV